MIGNRLEVLEAIDVLKGKIEGEIKDTCLEIASKMVALSKNISLSEALQEVRSSLENGLAYQKFVEWITMQGGNLNALTIDAKKIPYFAKESGTIRKIHAKKVAFCAKELGSARDYLDDEIDYSSGICLCKKEGEKVEAGEVLAYLYTNKETLPDLEECFEIIS